MPIQHTNTFLDNIRPPSQAKECETVIADGYELMSNDLSWHFRQHYLTIVPRVFLKDRFIISIIMKTYF